MNKPARTDAYTVRTDDAATHNEPVAVHGLVRVVLIIDPLSVRRTRTRSGWMET